MIIGSPYRFSIFVEAIQEWNAEGSHLKNGVFLLCIDGELFPKQIVTSTFDIDIVWLKKDLSNITVNRDLFTMEKEKAFVKMYNITFPEWSHNDYQYFISSPSLEDYNCIAFVVSNGEQVRIMAAKLNYIIEESTHDLGNMDISETFITHDELNKIILELDNVIV